MEIEAVSGSVRLRAVAVPMGEDLCVAVTGGDRPHIGCTSLAVPHPGISDPARPSATVSTLNLTAHRDGQIADQLAKLLSSALGRPVAVVCGVHFDHFSPTLENDTHAAVQALSEAILRQR